MLHALSLENDFSLGLVIMNSYITKHENTRSIFKLVGIRYLFVEIKTTFSNYGAKMGRGVLILYFLRFQMGGILNGRTFCC